MHRVSRSGRCALILAFAVCAGVGTPLQAQAQVRSKTQGQSLKVVEGGAIEISFQNEEIAVIVEQVARATGARFLFDDKLRGRITISAGRPVRPEEALAILDAALLAKGFAVLRSGSGLRKVLPIRDVQAGAPFEVDRKGGPAADRVDLIGTLVQLSHVRAEDIAAKLQHLVSDFGSLIAYPPSNSLILVGSQNAVRRLMELAHSLDSRSPTDLLIRTLKHRTASVAGEIIGEIIEPTPGQPELRIWVDDRTNSLVLQGSPRDLERARRLLARFDYMPPSGGRLQVVRIWHRNAEELAKVISAMSAGRRPRSAAGPATLQGSETLVGRSFVVVAAPSTNSLIIEADPDTIAIVRDLVAELDRVQPRVLVEVVAYEVSNPTQLRLGFDWFLPALTPSGAEGTTLTMISNPTGGGLRAEASPDLTFFGRASRSPLVLPFVGPNGIPTEVVVPRESAVMTADSREVQTRILLQPRLLMTSGEEQSLFVGQNVPIIVGQNQANLLATQTSVRVERQDVGVTLRIEANLGQSGKVNLELLLEVSRVGDSVAGDVNQVGPTLEKRQVETRVSLANGEMAVIGMSHEQQQNSSVRTTPFIGKIPVLRHLVSSKREGTRDTHLIFTVQAKILRGTDEDFAESIRQRLAMERALSRTRGLERIPGAPYAVRVITREDESEARAIAASLTAAGGRAQVGSFRAQQRSLYDVYLTGYADLALAGRDSLRLRERGFDPQVLVLSPDTALAAAPPFRPFARTTVLP